MSETLKRLERRTDEFPSELLEELREGRNILRERERNIQWRSERSWIALAERARAELGPLWEHARLAEVFAEDRTAEFLMQLPRWRAVLRVRYDPCPGVPGHWRRAGLGVPPQHYAWAVCPTITSPESRWEYAHSRAEALARAERLEVPASLELTPDVPTHKTP